MATKATCLFSLGKVKAWLGATSGEQDTEIEQLANGVSEFIERYTNRLFVRRVLNETRDGDGRPLLYLRRFPVNTVTSLTIKRSLTGTPETIDSAKYTLDGARGAVMLHEDVFTCGFANVGIGYDVGYAIQDSDELPQDIVHTAKDIVKLTYVEWSSNAVASSTLQFGSTQLILRPDWPKHIKTTLGAWVMPI